MITDRILDWARRDSGRVALLHDDTVVTYAALARGIDAARRYLAIQNLPTGGTAVVIVSNLKHAWFVVLGLRLSGLDTICAQSSDQVPSLGLRNAACLVTTDSDGLTGPTVQGLRVITIPTATFAAIDLGDGLPDFSGDRPCGGHVLHTSGSTGARKKLLSQSGIEDQVNQLRAQFFACDSMTVHHGFDFGLWTGIGYRQSAAVWHCGGRVVIDQRAGSEQRFLDHKITRASMVPQVLKEILDSMDPSTSRNDDLEIRVGGGNFPLEIAETAVNRLTRHLTIAYTMTELSRSPLQSLFQAADDLTWLTPTAGMTIEVVDEAGSQCPVGDEGAVRIRRTALDFDAYFEDEPASAKAFSDGYFYPGDMAMRRADGRIRILGRAGDVLNIGGQKVAAAPLELEMQRRLRVEEVCLFSRPMKDHGQELVIAIQTDRDLPQYEIDGLAGEFDLFDRVGVAIFAQFPRTTGGTRKTIRSELKDRAFLAARPASRNQV